MPRNFRIGLSRITSVSTSSRTKRNADGTAKSPSAHSGTDPIVADVSNNDIDDIETSSVDYVAKENHQQAKRQQPPFSPRRHILADVTNSIIAPETPPGEYAKRQAANASRVVNTDIVIPATPPAARALLQSPNNRKSTILAPETPPGESEKRHAANAAPVVNANIVIPDTPPPAQIQLPKEPIASVFSGVDNNRQNKNRMSQLFLDDEYDAQDTNDPYSAFEVDDGYDAHDSNDPFEIDDQEQGPDSSSQLLDDDSDTEELVPLPPPVQISQALVPAATVMTFNRQSFAKFIQPNWNSWQVIDKKDLAVMAAPLKTESDPSVNRFGPFMRLTGAPSEAQVRCLTGAVKFDSLLELNQRLYAIKILTENQQRELLQKHSDVTLESLGQHQQKLSEILGKQIQAADCPIPLLIIDMVTLSVENTEGTTSDLADCLIKLIKSKLSLNPWHVVTAEHVNQYLNGNPLILPEFILRSYGGGNLSRIITPQDIITSCRSKCNANPTIKNFFQSSAVKPVSAPVAVAGQENIAVKPVSAVPAAEAVQADKHVDELLMEITCKVKNSIDNYIADTQEKLGVVGGLCQGGVTIQKSTAICQHINELLAAYEKCYIQLEYLLAFEISKLRSNDKDTKDDIATLSSSISKQLNHIKEAKKSFVDIRNSLFSKAIPDLMSRQANYKKLEERCNAEVLHRIHYQQEQNPVAAPILAL